MLAGPFEAAVSALLIFSGIVIIARIGPPDPIDILLPRWEVDMLAVMFLLAGASTLAGLTIGRASVEGAGLLLLSGSLVIQLILYLYYLGADARFVLSGIVDAMFVAAAAGRLLSIRSRRVVIEVSRTGEGQ